LAAANTGNFIPIKANNFFDSTATSTVYLRDAPIELNGAKMYCEVKSCSQGFFSDTIDIKIKSKKLNFYIPTAFTPNGDNINEVLEIVGIKNTEIQGIIYNRWGQSLFTFSKFNPIWDGTFNGNDVSTGLYDYVITNQGKGCSNLEVKGYVSVIR
jgi:gliding motility-associated-like protein